MGLRKRSKVTATFSMSSLTDIIFLLLIFFMLTSSLVTPSALNLKLPGRNTSTATSKDKVPEITISSRGTYRLDGSRTNIEAIQAKMKSLSRKQNAAISISPDQDAPIESVVPVMALAKRYHLDAYMSMED
jgi:biopolymer transport protein ExbD